MRVYVATTGVIFGLIAVAHVWRIIEERAGLAAEPFFLLVTVLAAGLCLWACRLLWRPPHA